MNEQTYIKKNILKNYKTISLETHNSWFAVNSQSQKDESK